MWPWEHLAVGYLVYAVGRRILRGRRPTEAAALTIALATQLPDLVDKPLAWTLHVLPSGTSLAHSVLFAVPLTIVVATLAARRGRSDVAVAFAVGYGTHLLGDIVYPALVGGALAPGKVLWPLVPVSAGPTDGLLVTFESLLATFTAFLGTPQGRYYLAGELLLLGIAVAWWLYDGAPGVRSFVRPVTQ